MKAVRQGDSVVLIATVGEAAAIAGCLNEALEAIEDWEFETRVGVSAAAVLDLRSVVGDVLREPM